jgi:hypothetical protein
MRFINLFEKRMKAKRESGVVHPGQHASFKWGRAQTQQLGNDRRIPRRSDGARLTWGAT